MRVQVEVTGTKTVVASLDPEEFRGMSRLEVMYAVLRTVQDIDPAVNFFSDDVIYVVQELVGVSGSIDAAGG